MRVVESRSQDINQNQVVSDVVSALQPSIEAAIAEALASLSSNSVSSSSSGSVFSSGSSGLAATGGATAAVQEVPARYNYEYKVADSDAQNYISKSENRNGDTTTGSYSYVDPNGQFLSQHLSNSHLSLSPQETSSLSTMRQDLWDTQPSLRNRKDLST